MVFNRLEGDSVHAGAWQTDSNDLIDQRDPAFETDQLIVSDRVRVSEEIPFPSITPEEADALSALVRASFSAVYDKSSDPTDMGGE